MAATITTAAFQVMWDADFARRDALADPREALAELIADVAAPLVDSAARTLEAGGASVWEPLREGVGPRAVWDDLRPSEALALMRLVEEARDRAAARCAAVVEEELAAAAAAFLAAHPDVRTAAA